MIRSMTGFGSGEVQGEHWTVRVEVRSVNHKDLQISCRIPDSLYAKESELQKRFEQHVRRGHLYVAVQCEARADRGDALVDEERVSAYLRALKAVAASEDVPLSVDLANLLRLPGALRDQSIDRDCLDEIWPLVLDAADAAAAALVAMRVAEGANLAEQLGQIAAGLDELVNAIEAEQGTFVEGYRDRLRQRVNRLLESTGVVIQEETLAREVALYADRSDVSEEIARLRSHLAQFRQAMAGNDDEPVGRRMEFLGQEMLREAGTIAAKVPAGPQVDYVLDLKSHVERVREQVRNVE